MLGFRWQRSGQEGNEVRLDTNGTGARTTTTMRRATRLVQIEMHHVKAHIPWSRDTEYSVGVGTIIIELPTHIMYQFGNLSDIGIEEAERVGVGHHNSSD